MLTADPAITLAASRTADQLLCIDGDRALSIALPSSGELVIGRGPDAGLSVDDPLVSRAHALLLVGPTACGSAISGAGTARWSTATASPSRAWPARAT